jgi:proliferating cell nuclear antigen
MPLDKMKDLAVDAACYDNVDSDEQSHTDILAPSPNNILEIKTVQASTFKQVIDALKEILMDVNLEFDDTGMKIVALDNTHVVLVHLKLDADKFESFFCEKKLFVGINMLKLHLLIKTISNNDVLTLFVDRNDSNRLGINIENQDKNMRTTYKLSMLDINVVRYSIPPVDFQTVITMPSVDFQKIIRDMHNLADYIEIRSVGNQITLSCKGDFCSQETIIGGDKNPGVTITKHNPSDQEIIQGVYSLKYLSTFTKCTNMSTNVEIFFKNQYPLILSYLVSSIGIVRMACSQQET